MGDRTNIAAALDKFDHCTGGWVCPAVAHFHGCHCDDGNCDRPAEHTAVPLRADPDTEPDGEMPEAFSVVLDELIAVEPDDGFSRGDVARAIVGMLQSAGLLTAEVLTDHNTSDGLFTEARRLLDAATPIGEDVPGYYVTREGQVLSATGWRGSAVRELVPIADKDGYLRVRMTMPSGKRVRASVHGLVARAFLGPCPPGHQCRHLNGDKTDNRAVNLAWGTAAENADDRDSHGSTVRGERSPNTALTEQDVRNIRALLSDGQTQRAVADAYGVTQGTIYKIAARKSWAHVTDEESA